MNITKIISKISNSSADKPYVIGVCGGSGSGKSYLSEELKNELNNAGYETLIINQDDFCLGRIFPNKNQSIYKWDDPENYRIDDCYNAIESLLSLKPYTFMAYTLEKHEPCLEKNLKFSDTNKTIIKVIILEGIYAWYGKLSELVDYKIYLEVNYLERFVLRLNRNINQIGNVDFNTVVRHFFSNVWLAEKDFLVSLKSSSDTIIERKVTFDNIDKRHLPKYLKIANKNYISLYRSDSVSIFICGNNFDSYRMIIIIKDRILFDEELNAENYKLIRSDFDLLFSAGQKR